MKSRFRGQIVIAWVTALGIARLAAGESYFPVQIENPDFGPAVVRLGQSVAIDGDTILAGAPFSFPAGVYLGGVACVYARDAHGHWSLQQELGGDFPHETRRMGDTVALSGDTAVIAAVDWAVYIYQRRNSFWSVSQILPVPDGSAGFGESLAFDGSTIVVGAPATDLFTAEQETIKNCGAAFVFVKGVDGWNQQSKLIAQDAESGDYFGRSVAVVDETIAVGSPNSDDSGLESCGSVYIYEESGDTWTQSAKLQSPSPNASVYLGLSVGLSENQVVAGMPGSDSLERDAGEVLVFEKMESGWVHVKSLWGSQVARDHKMGDSICVSGSDLVVGSEHDPHGRSYVFTRTDVGWSETAVLKGTGLFVPGHAVSISNGNVVVGSASDSEYGRTIGALYVFSDENGAWSCQAKLSEQRAGLDRFSSGIALDESNMVIGSFFDNFARFYNLQTPELSPKAKVRGTEVSPNDNFGVSAGISGDVAVVGSNHAGYAYSAGEAFIYRKTGENWVEEGRLGLRNGKDDLFGDSCAIDGSRIMVGAPFDENPFEIPEGTFDARSGSAFVYAKQADEWRLEAELNSGSEAQQTEQFGWSVDLEGERAIVGLPGWWIDGAAVGAVRTFKRSGDAWVPEAMLRHEGFDSWSLGLDLAISGDTIAAGAPGGLGDVYLFRLTAGAWGQEARLSAPKGDERAGFGHAVALDGDLLAVTAIDAIANDSPTGAVHLYRRIGGDWFHTARLTSPDNVEAESFGDELAMDRGRLLISDPEADAPEYNSGVTWLYDLNAKNAATAWSRYP